MLDSFREQGIVVWFFALEYEAGEINLNNLPLNTHKGAGLDIRRFYRILELF